MNISRRMFIAAGAALAVAGPGELIRQRGVLIPFTGGSVVVYPNDVIHVSADGSEIGNWEVDRTGKVVGVRRFADRVELEWV